MFFLQTLFFSAVAFGLGCLFGCWLKGRLRPPRHHSGAAGAITHAGAARATTSGELASSRPHYEPASRAQREADLPPPPSAGPDPVAPQAGAIAPAAVAPVVPDAPAAAPRARKPVARKAAAKPARSKSAPSEPVAAETVPTPAAPKSAASKPRTAKAAAAKPAAKARAAKAKPQAATIPDNLKQIKGVGPQIEAKLNAAGINSFAQIAAWTKKEQAEFAEQLSFAGRIEREDWVSQAKILAKGGSTDFARRVARGEVESSVGKPGRGGKS